MEVVASDFRRIHLFPNNLGPSILPYSHMMVQSSPKSSWRTYTTPLPQRCFSYPYSCMENPMGGGAWYFHFSLSCIGEGNGNPLQCSCLENPMDRGAWWAAVSGVAQSWTRLKRLSSSSSKDPSPSPKTSFFFFFALEF